MKPSGSAEAQRLEQDRWQEGTSAYSRFFWSLNPRERDELYCPPGSETAQNPGTLQAVFLGEKPMVFEGYSASICAKLKKAGLGIAGPYAYDRDAVSRILQNHADAFTDFPTDDPDVFMAAFADRSITECDRQRGLLLGFPQSAVEHFEGKGNRDQELANIQMGIDPNRHPHAWALMMDFRSKHLKDKTYWVFQFLRDHLQDVAEEIEMLPVECVRRRQEAADACTCVGYSVYGVHWKDRAGSADSDRKAAHLKKAFERSGILRVDDREKVKRALFGIGSACIKRIRSLFRARAPDGHGGGHG